MSRCECRCPLCWLANRLHGRPASPTTPPAELSTEALVRTWSATRIGQFLYELEHGAAMRPGADRAASIELLRGALNEKES